MPSHPWPVTIGVTDRDIELAVAPGDTVLLTGASGTRKSTLLRAITGHPAPGIDIRLGSVEVAAIDPQQLAGHITLVAQDAYVFGGTVRDNLRLAAPHAGERELREALAAAALDDTVAAFPAGLDTPVGPGGEAQDATLVIALHDRQTPLVPWAPTARLELP